jgi:hypothetical protein
MAQQQPAPTVDEIVATMLERDAQRQAASHGYTAVRRYTLQNPKHHKHAEMLVQVDCLENGVKEFRTVSDAGWGMARNHVFPKLLEGEKEASLPGERERSRITPKNYTFQLVGTVTADQRPAYRIAIMPKTQNKYLIRGEIWVDADEYAIVRIEGKPAKNPSFWVKSVQFVHTYQKSGGLWLPATDRSITDARFVGSTELTIEYFEYTHKAPVQTAMRGVDGGR